MVRHTDPTTNEPQFKPDEVREMRRSFDGLDKDGGGSLDQAELIEATKACGVDDVEEDDIASMLSKVVTDTTARRTPWEGRGTVPWPV